MFNGFLTILQFIWPFFKEALFGNGTSRDWLRRNYGTVLWFCMILIMLILVLVLVSLLKQSQESLSKAHDTAQNVAAKVTKLEASVKDLTAKNQVLTARNHQLSLRHCPSEEEPHPSSHHAKSTPVDHTSENSDILHRLRTH